MEALFSLHVRDMGGDSPSHEQDWTYMCLINKNMSKQVAIVVYRKILAMIAIQET